jgi:hypothetical protein
MVPALCPSTEPVPPPAYTHALAKQPCAGRFARPTTLGTLVTRRDDTYGADRPASAQPPRVL